MLEGVQSFLRIQKWISDHRVPPNTPNILFVTSMEVSVNRGHLDFWKCPTDKSAAPSDKEYTFRFFSVLMPFMLLVRPGLRSFATSMVKSSVV